MLWRMSEEDTEDNDDEEAEHNGQWDEDAEHHAEATGSWSWLESFNLNKVG